MCLRARFVSVEDSYGSILSFVILKTWYSDIMRKTSIWLGKNTIDTQFESNILMILTT